MFYRRVFWVLSQGTIASSCGEVNSCRSSELLCACCSFNTSRLAPGTAYSATYASVDRLACWIRRHRQTITAMYAARKLYGCSLGEAKELVESLRENEVPR